jgi:hypothetical protein
VATITWGRADADLSVFRLVVPRQPPEIPVSAQAGNCAYLAAVCRSIPSALAMAYGVSPFAALRSYIQRLDERLTYLPENPNACTGGINLHPNLGAGNAAALRARLARFLSMPCLRSDASLGGFFTPPFFGALVLVSASPASQPFAVH